jgi:hypothetical protein|tara:strand:- start:5288 stop:5740 length:453 start_codon:yes stop_codon:yes gene_type:complete
MNLRFNKILKATMPKSKIKHSNRVFNKLDGLPSDVKYAALFHDYLESGGSLSKIEKVLPPKTIDLIKLLTITDDTSVIEHIKKTLKSGDITTQLSNFLILIKIADRKDNYNKRVSKGKLTKKYKKKSKTLLAYLIKQYNGPRQLLKDALS